jgi:hypothetical protein
MSIKIKVIEQNEMFTDEEARISADHQSEGHAPGW